MWFRENATGEAARPLRCVMRAVMERVRETGAEPPSRNPPDEAKPKQFGLVLRLRPAHFHIPPEAAGADETKEDSAFPLNVRPPPGE